MIMDKEFKYFTEEEEEKYIAWKEGKFISWITVYYIEDPLKPSSW